MRKMIFSLMLAMVSSVWMANEASNWCMPSVRTTTEPWIEVNGTFQAEGFPCEPEPDEVCPTCLTIVLVTNNKTYYLVTDDGQLIEYLDTIQLGTKATVSGIPFEHGSYDYIQVSHIETDQKLPSLCDEWNVLHEPFSCDGIYCRLQTLIYRLTTDTLIQDVNYVKLMEQEGSNTYYKGAMREGTNRDIYYVPAGSTNEFLLYAFNAQVGEVLNDLYLGGFEENGYSGRVEAISDNSPRLFTIRVLYPAGMGVEPGESFVTWIEGVGSPETPYGLAVVPTVPADIGVYTLLCAYKNGEQVYSSSKSERYGCEFNGIPSTKPYHLCDEWNVLEISNVTCGYCEEYRTYNFHLTTDTVIGGLLYSQLIKDGAYKGALREGNNRDIYCVPAGCSQEYLLYAFNAQVGDSLKNIWVGGNSSWIPDVRSAIVSEIKQTTPRTIELEVHYYEAPDAYEESIRNLTWIEGIGMPFGPMGAECSVFNGCADSKAKLLLCAYKNGEQVYTSTMGEQYGCEYNYNPDTTHTDTIPLYARDNSGSSTVDPVDPNQIYATLMGNVLTVHNNTGAQVTFTVNNISVKNVAARVRSNVEPVSFTDSVSTELSEDGIYEILLTSEEWNYTIFGMVNYIRSAAGNTKEDPASTTKKILRGTQILIEREGKTYTLTGQEVK